MVHYQIMFYGGMAGAVITLAISIFIFIKYNILQVFEDLTGISLHNKKNSASKSYRNERRVIENRVTTEIKLRKNPFINWTNALKGMARTNISGNMINSTNLVNRKDDRTVLLNEDEDNETTLLTELQNETTLISNDSDETTLLTDLWQEPEIEPFKKQVDIMVIHSEGILTE